MQNKFSKLQRFILAETYKRKYINSPMILIEWFGFVPFGSGKIKFKPEFIGENKYKSGSVSVARSLTRLRHRGLVRRSHFYGHHELTESGHQLVKEWLEFPHDKKDDKI